MTTIRSFLISPVCPTLLIPIAVVVFNLYNSIRDPQHSISVIVLSLILMVLVIWAIIRWWLEQTLNVVKKYSLLMEPLEELSGINGTGNQAISKVIKSRLNLVSCQKIEESQRNLNKKFNELNDKLYKWIKNPYRLINVSTDVIGNEFSDVVITTKRLYEDFMEMAKKSDDIQPGDLDAAGVPNSLDAYKQFISELKQCRRESIDIRDAIRKDLLVIPYLPSYGCINPYS